MKIVLLAILVSGVCCRPSLPNAGFTRPGVGSIGLSGMVLNDGSIVQFDRAFIDDIVSIGESGIVTKSGRNVQLTRDLHRVKRSHIMNDSGILTSWGQAIVFKKPHTTIVSEGPGGIVFSDGTLVQKPLQL
ncbi:hypothetical protein Pcinc_043428 [Petrolisthes cinctipes]|uniref:Uncharacterized protein n=1 Tax=Petrolisthes cinctipes TaxID=88211 RepID=A0AAE1BGJ4_PETCI|nr:hypothetical protein Pcinc_043428 [Petrolisthes cinctipes]